MNYCNTSDIFNLIPKNCKNGKKLKILYFNSQSLSNKLNALNSLLSTLNYDIICVTETWLNGKISDSLLLHNLPYSIVRCDRITRQGGGSCIFIANYLSFKIVSKTSIFDADITCVDIFDEISLDSFRIVNVYTPPNFKNVTHYNSFVDYLAELISIDFPFYITGDFNAPKINWKFNPLDMHYPTSSVEKLIIDFVHVHHLRQHVLFTTRKDNTLDLLFTPTDTIVHDLISLPPFGLDKQADHLSFSFSIQHTKTENRPAHSVSKNFHMANYSIVNNYFSSIHWQSIFSLCPTTNELGVYDPAAHLNNIYSTFTNIVHDAINAYVPNHKVKSMFTSYPKHIKSLMKYRLQLWHDKKVDKIKFAKCSKRLNREVKKFLQYRERKNLSKINSKYKYVRLFLKTKNRKIPTLAYNNNMLLSERDKCEALAETFQSIYNHSENKNDDIHIVKVPNTLDFVHINFWDVYSELKKLTSKINASSDGIPEMFIKKCRDSLCAPISYILQFCVMTKTIPKIWKHSIVTPIEKVPNSTNPLDYRPISLLPTISKLFEKIIFSKISSFLSSNNVIPKCQHGFQRHKSVTTQLVETFEDFSLAHENKLSVDVVYLDISKAFDSVPHSRLIKKLQTYGICGPLLELIKNYLSNRTYTVRVGKSYSNKKSIPSGVPQGSVGGPILFIAYLADIIHFCQTREIVIKLFADDLKAYHLFKQSINNPPLQLFINTFVQYCKINGLKIAPNKCKVLHIGKNNPQTSYFLSSNPIECIEDNKPIRDLGLHFKSDLKWDAHIDIVTKKARRTAFAILKSIKSNDPKLLINLFNTFVRPTLEFATNVYNPYLLKDILAIEKVQKSFLRSIHKKSNWKLYKDNKFAPVPTYSELLCANCLESLKIRRLKSDLILFHKFLHGEAKINCKNPYEIRETKTRGEKYKIFPVSCQTIIRHNSFFVRTSRIYSLLPSEIRHTNVKSFKVKLNSHCLSKFLKCKL